jgi:hypothetical protein
MKAKAILLGAILAAVTTASQAQTNPVYSVNVVGYTKIVFPANQFKMIANQLQGTNITIPALFPSATALTAVYKFNGTGYNVAQFVDGAWEGAALSLAPGEGAFVFTPQSFTNIFSGDVVLVSTNSLPSGYSIRSSVVPQAGLLQTQLGFPAGALDAIYRFNGSGYTTSQLVDGAWEGAGEPNVQVGESFFVNNASATKNWVRTFTVQ